MLPVRMKKPAPTSQKSCSPHPTRNPPNPPSCFIHGTHGMALNSAEEISTGKSLHFAQMRAKKPKRKLRLSKSPAVELECSAPLIQKPAAGHDIDHFQPQNSFPEDVSSYSSIFLSVSKRPL